MTVFDPRRKVGLQEAHEILARQEGSRFAEVFRHGSLSIEIYAPRGRDLQSPHLRDEVYVVIQGEGFYASDAGRQRFAAGDLLFAPARVPHRFEDFSADLLVWVIFYGPDGGERGTVAGPN